MGGGHSPHAMRLLPLAAALLLAACSSMDTHRAACSEQLGLAPAIPVKDSDQAEPDPAVEACADQRRLAEQDQVGRGIALGLGVAALAAAAVVIGGASGGGYRQHGYHQRPYRHHPAYARPYRRW
jgi:hypothetical protein